MIEAAIAIADVDAAISNSPQTKKETRPAILIGGSFFCLVAFWPVKSEELAVFSKLPGHPPVLFLAGVSVFQKKCTVAYERIPSHPNQAVHFFWRTDWQVGARELQPWLSRLITPLKSIQPAQSSRQSAESGRSWASALILSGSRKTLAKVGFMGMGSLDGHSESNHPSLTNPFNTRCIQPSGQTELPWTLQKSFYDAD